MTAEHVNWAAAEAATTALAGLALVWAGAKLMAALARRLGQLGILGELVAGIVLGPAVLGWLQPTDVVKTLAQVGVVLLMFLIGLETNVLELRRNALRAFWVALIGIVAAFAGGWAVARAFGADHAHAVFAGVLLMATSVTVSAETLRELGMLDRREGTTVLAAAVCDDILGLLALTLVLGVLTGDDAGPLALMGKQLLLVAAFTALAALAARPVAAALDASRRLPVPELLGSLAGAAALLFAVGAERFGLAGIIGAYLLGLLLKIQRPELADTVQHRLAGPAVTFFTPFFFASVGLLLPGRLPGGNLLVLALVLVAVAVVSKLVGCGTGAWLGGFRGRAALTIGAAMTVRGEVALVVAAVGRDRGLVDTELYVAMAVVAVVTTLIAPPLIDAVAGLPRGAVRGMGWSAPEGAGDPGEALAAATDAAPLGPGQTEPS